MTRGFITLAVGRDSYYELAYNLLMSYRKTNDHAYPWALVCDRQNKWTAEFDDVILLESATCSYMDKLRLFALAPYDQTIFIDADCLIYQNIDCLWNRMEQTNAIAGFGRALPLDSCDGWFLVDDIGHWKDQISFIPQMHGGICFIKKGHVLDLVLKYASDIEQHYSDYKFKYFDKPADEPILALAMAAANCRPIKADVGDFVFLPTVKKLLVKDVIWKQRAVCMDRNNNLCEFRIVHFQNHNTKKMPYKVSRDVLMRHISVSVPFRSLGYIIADIARPWYSRFCRIFKCR